ncbi:MAG: sulfite exporter TauE/SafE family protein [Tannerella sp.]|jgi:uncharacterized membrane protein YfcA|nr:sulfite exporter TauE/SafE family protein [Tannerella sp.]
MDTLQLFSAGIVILLTHALEAVTGFGCTVLAFPFVLMLLDGDMEHSKIILSIFAWILAAYFAIAKSREINWKQLGIIAGLAGAGMPAGMLMFKSMDGNTLMRILGIFIIFTAAIQLYKASFQQRVRTVVPRYLYLFFGGVVHGAFATGGPLIVLYSAHKITDKGQFRATMCLLWAMLNSVLLIQYFMEKKITETVGCELLFLFPFLILGIIAGEVTHKRVSETLFKKVVFASLLLVGITMIFNVNK